MYLFGNRGAMRIVTGWAIVITHGIMCIIHSNIISGKLVFGIITTSLSPRSAWYIISKSFWFKTKEIKLFGWNFEKLYWNLVKITCFGSFYRISLIILTYLHWYEHYENQNIYPSWFWQFDYSLVIKTAWLMNSLAVKQFGYEQLGNKRLGYESLVINYSFAVK